MKKTLSIVAMIALVAVLGIALVACIPSDPDKAAENLEKEGYTVLANEDATKALAGFIVPEGCEAIVFAYKGYIPIGADDAIRIYYFEETEDAKEYWETIKDDELEDGWDAKQSGKIVYKGSKEAIKAAA